MDTKVKLVLFLLLVAAAAWGAGGKESADAETKELVIFNAASTTDLVNDLAAMFAKRSGIKTVSNPASSGTLARQLEQGAGADIYISASAKWMEYVDGLGLAARQSQFALNRLVLVAPAALESEMKTALGSADGSAVPVIKKGIALQDVFSGRISIGDPAHVPAGAYAEEALTWVGCFGALESRIQPAADVRAAMAVVELAECALGVVYETDAKKSDKVAVVGVFPEESHKPVVYYCAVLTSASPGADALYDFMLNDSGAAEVFRKYGFSLIAQPPGK